MIERRFHALTAGPTSGEALDEAGQFLKVAIETVRAGESLSADRAAAMMELIVAGKMAPLETEAYLIALADKGESVEEIVGSARVLREYAIPFPASGECIDNCGTGGDGAGTFNISTVAAIVVAAAGLPVVKHGNRSASGRVGSADLLEALGVPVELGVRDAADCLNRFGFTFLFAPLYHPAARNVAPIRRKIGRPTLFNLLGPLCNPACPAYQFLGVASVAIAEKMARVLLQLGIRRAFVSTGCGGVDEWTSWGCNEVLEVADGRITRREFRASDAEIAECALGDLRGGGVQRNLEIALAILRGDRGPARDVVILNGAGALLCSGSVGELGEGAERCADAIDSRKALDLLEGLRTMGGSMGGGSRVHLDAPPGGLS